MSRLYSLRKSRRILHGCYSRLKKKEKILSAEEKSRIETDLRELEEAVFAKDREKANGLARHVEDFCSEKLKKSTFELAFEIVVAIALALVIATCVRQMWFELYEIPTGSMRPSFKEQDHLTVTKTSFGINIPLQTKHFYFDPDLVRRAGVVIFSGDNIPLPDTDTTYFGIFPSKKRYIKRLIGKPGDVLYFYGGKIYGIDKDGRPIDELLTDFWMQKLERIPFLTFEGEVYTPTRDQILFHQMNLPIGKFNFSRRRGEIMKDKTWVQEQTDKNEGIQSYGDFWGMKNFAMARLLTKEELKAHTDVNVEDLDEGILYLQLRHHPNLTYPQIKVFRQNTHLGARVPTLETVIPLRQEHLDTLMNNMYTARFVIKKGRAYRYDSTRSGSPGFSDVPDGTYEFYFGKGEKVGWKGKTSPVPENHPIYHHDPSRIQALFNLGVGLFHAGGSSNFLQFYYPNRYAYFRNGELYLMGAPLMKQDDPTLIQLLEDEEKRERMSTSSRPYHAFKDDGPPIKDGELDAEFIKAFGLTVPEKSYLVLGDNHAMSADSRVFGFVPEDNLQGVPSLIIWPPGERWGFPPQTPYPVLSLPRLIIWGIVIAIGLIWYAIHRRKMSKRFFTD